jgi:FkbM family methyltransferase
MKSFIKSMSKNMLASVGFELRRTRPGVGSFPSDPFLAQKEFIDRLDVSNPVIFDVGAHKGETVARYKELFVDSTIYCFEPFPDSAEILRSRFSSDPSVLVCQKAVSDIDAIKTFFVNDNDATNSLLPRTKDSRRYYSKTADSKYTVDVESVTIDEMMLQNDIDHINILKFDIQGGELMALKGAEKTLKENRVSVIYSETLFVPHYENNPLLLDLWNYLDKYNYSLFDIYDLYRATNGQLRFADTMFINNDTRSSVLDSYREEP